MRVGEKTIWSSTGIYWEFAGEIWHGLIVLYFNAIWFEFCKDSMTENDIQWKAILNPGISLNRVWKEAIQSRECSPHIKFHHVPFGKFTSLIYFSVFSLHCRVPLESQDTTYLLHSYSAIINLLRASSPSPSPSCVLSSPLSLEQMLILTWMTILTNIERGRIINETLPPLLSVEPGLPDTWFSVAWGLGKEREL